MAALVSSLALLALGAASAQAFIYWGNSDGTIGRAGPDGSSPNESFISGAQPCGVAVDASHIFWTNDTDDSTAAIGRANLDGGGVNQNLVSAGGVNPCGIATDGTHVYWANDVKSGSLWRATVDGGSPQQIIPSLSNPCGVAVDASHIYWGNRDLGTIGRADLDGGNSNPSFIQTGGNDVCGVAVDASHVYWTDFGTTTIGRANIDGGSPNNSFIDGASGPCGVAVDSSSVYWANDRTSTIGRADLSGGNVNQSLVTDPSVPCFVAADVRAAQAAPPPPAPPAQVAAAPRDTTAPTVHLSGIRHACIARTFRARISAADASGIASATVTLDGRRIKTATANKLAVRVNARTLRAGAHRLTVVITDRAGNQRRIVRRFSVCAARRAAAPHFTG